MCAGNRKQQRRLKSEAKTERCWSELHSEKKKQSKARQPGSVSHLLFINGLWEREKKGEEGKRGPLRACLKWNKHSAAFVYFFRWFLLLAKKGAKTFCGYWWAEVQRREQFSSSSVLLFALQTKQNDHFTAVISVLLYLVCISFCCFTSFFILNVFFCRFLNFSASKRMHKHA